MYTRQDTARIPQHVKKYLFKYWLAFQTEPLRLVFVFSWNKAQELGNLRIHPRQGMRGRNRVQHTDLCSFSHGHHRRLAVAIFVHRQDESAFEGRAIESSGGV